MRPLLKRYKLCKYSNKFYVSFHLILPHLAWAHPFFGLSAGVSEARLLCVEAACSQSLRSSLPFLPLLPNPIWKSQCRHMPSDKPGQPFQPWGKTKLQAQVIYLVLVISFFSLLTASSDQLFEESFPC